MRREWIEMSCIVALTAFFWSPSMRREWIEIFLASSNTLICVVSLHAEGVD